MPLSQTMKTDLVFKKIKGRRLTTPTKAWYEEFPGTLTFLHASETWVDTIPVPAPGTSTSVVQYYSDLKLTEDVTTEDHKAWLACETPGDLNTQLKGFIPPRFHQSYTVRVYEDDGAGNKGSEIPTAHESNWFFDYENGVLVFENDPTSYGLTPPFHIEVYRYIGKTVTDTSSETASKLRAFLREASSISVSSGSNSVDVTSQMTGKTPGGSETTTGVVTTAPYNRCPILTHPDRDEILTVDGQKVYGRLTESGGTWTLSFYYVAEDGTETAYTFTEDKTIIWGYYEVLEFNDWPVFPDEAVLPSDQVVGDIPDATTSIKGKVLLAEDNETTAGEVVRADDPRAVKAVDFALKNFNADGSNITLTIGSGVWNLNGDKTAETNLSIAQTADTYYLVYLNMNDGTVSITSDSSVPAVPENCQALYRFTTDSTGAVTVVEDVRPVYAMGVGGGTGLLGTPSDGTYEDGLLDFTPSTKINDAIDDINEVLLYLAPEDAEPLSGNIVWSNAFVTGKIADNVSLLYLTPGSSSSHIFNSSTLSGHLPDPSTKFNKADSGILRILVNETEADSFDLGSNFDESERNGCQSYTPANSPNNMLTITSVCWYNNFPLWQKGNANVSVPGISLGDIKVKVVHDVYGDGTVLHETNEFIGFYDAETARPGISTGPTVSENTPQWKYLSGIKFYGLNSTFDVNVTSDNHLFEYTYVDDPLRFEMPGMNTFNLQITDASVSGVSSPPKYDEQMTVTAKTITLDKGNEASDDAKLTVTPRDPWGDGTGATESITDKRLINTYGNVATDLIEYFQDENYRLPTTYNFDSYANAITGNWDSTQVLSNGNAQVFNGKLIFPHDNFTTGYLPSQNASADYSSFTGDQLYYRAFQQSGTPHNSGTLFIGGITSSDIGTNVEIHIKLPTQTGWLSLQDDFLAGSFSGADGDGARTAIRDVAGGVEIDWTSGTYSTANSGYRYYVRVTIKNTSVEITRLEEKGW